MNGVLFYMAWRNIWRNKLRSIVIMLSVAIGMLAGIAVLALYAGMMAGRIRTLIETETGHLQVHHPRFKDDMHPAFLLPQVPTLQQQLQQNPLVKAVAFRSSTAGMLATANGSAGVQILGIDPAAEIKVSAIDQKVMDGSLFAADASGKIIIGKKLADKVRLKKGSRLVLTFSDTAGNMISAAFRISALYRSDNSKLDEQLVYVPQAELSNLLGTPGQVQEAVVLLHSNDKVHTVAQALHRNFPSLLTETWPELSPETDLMVRTVDQYSYIIMIIIMFALAFGIVNTMLMAVLERTREIGMMVALGTSRLRIFLLVFLETLLLTLVGTPLGIAAGWALSAYYHTYGLDLSGMGTEMMSSFGFQTMIYPIFPAERLPGVLLIVMLTALLSCLFPAIRALRLQAAEAMRI